MRYAFLLTMALALAACASDEDPGGVPAVEPPGALPRPPSGDRVPDVLRPPR